MSRLARRRLLTLAATTAAVLAVPAAANAATYSVSPGAGGCGGADLACGGLAEAKAAVVDGDTVDVTPGAYPGASFSVGVTINGAAGVLITSTVEFTGGTVSKLSKVAVAQTGTGDGVRVTGGSGLELSDAIVVSQGGNGVLFSGGAANKILRSVVTAGTGPSAIRVTGASGVPAKTVLIESTIAGGGVSGVGAVTTAGLAAGGAITITMHHVTAAGTTNGILLDASAGALPVTGGGSITATATDSIALNNSSKANAGIAGLGANSATLNATRTLTTGDKATIFANPGGLNFRLRPDAAVAIGQGSTTPGESTTDFEGEDRSTAPTDLGGDEYNNAPPVAKLMIATKTPRATQAVRFDATTSIDRETGYGGGIVQYQWLYSDGTGETTTTPTVDHVFAKEGNAAVQLTVVDRQGAASAPVAAGFVLVDGTAPFVSIVKPKNKARIKIFTTKTKTVDGKKTTTKKRTKIVLGGLSKDANGVAAIILTLEKVKAPAPAQASAASTARCTWYDPKKGLKQTSCLKPTLITARLVQDSKTGEWTYSINKNLTKGTYRLTALGVDKAGVFGNAGGSKLGVIRFTLI